MSEILIVFIYIAGFLAFYIASCIISGVYAQKLIEKRYPPSIKRYISPIVGVAIVFSVFCGACAAYLKDKGFFGSSLAWIIPLAAASGATAVIAVGIWIISMKSEPTDFMRLFSTSIAVTFILIAGLVGPFIIAALMLRIFV
jgi:hypothetical protein